jgi:hypothetical protein
MRDSQFARRRAGLESSSRWRIRAELARIRQEAFCARQRRASRRSHFAPIPAWDRGSDGAATGPGRRAPRSPAASPAEAADIDRSRSGAYERPAEGVGYWPCSEATMSIISL